LANVTKPEKSIQCHEAGHDKYTTDWLIYWLRLNVTCTIVQLY